MIRQKLCGTVGQMMTILTEFGVESRAEKEGYLRGSRIFRGCGDHFRRTCIRLWTGTVSQAHMIAVPLIAVPKNAH